MSAVLFGSISTLADTSELQRHAFNQAFAQHGLDWSWDQEEYAGLLVGNGGRDRVAAYATDRGEEVDAAAVHETKSAIFQRSLGETQLSPRPGVVETIAAAHDQGLKVGLVTTTSPDNVTALLAALGPEVGADVFDVVTDVTSTDASKPDPAAYVLALETLGEQAGTCIAIEDNLGGVEAALAAGLKVVAFPNANTAAHDFDAATVRVEVLDPAELIAHTS